LPINIHGDAAFAGQACLLETFQMSRPGVQDWAGPFHIIVQQPGGFTTSRQD